MVRTGLRPGLVALLAIVSCSLAAVVPGVVVLQRDNWKQLQGKRIGVISNPTGILPDTLEHIVNVMHADARLNVVAVFGPEHGFRGDRQAGEGEDFYVDAQTQLPVFSVYGKRGTALVNILRNSTAEALVFDIQDCGVRFYTYMWTMYDCMVAAAELGLEFVVLDRPNPLGAERVAGPVLKPEFASGVGRLPIAQQPGMTIGELALMFNAKFMPSRPVALTVIKMEGYRRNMTWEETGLPWVPTSPNIPTPDSARAYVGFGYLEGTNCSTGRGTTRPFELVGAPYIGNGTIARKLNALRLPGVRFRDAYFIPTFDRYVNVVNGGTQLYVTDQAKFDGVRTALEWIYAVKHTYAKDFSWQPPSAAVAVGGEKGGFLHKDTEAPVNAYWIDLLAGTDQVRKMLDAGATVDELMASWEQELAEFRELRSHFLLYD